MTSMALSSVCRYEPDFRIRLLALRQFDNTLVRFRWNTNTAKLCGQ